MAKMDDKSRIMTAADSVVFAVAGSGLEVLLVRRRNPPFKGLLALPGGFVEQGESPYSAALRELKEETGIEGIALSKFSVYEDPERDPRGRIISVAFVSLVRAGLTLSSGSDAASAMFIDMESLPELAFDHNKIIRDALVFLRSEIRRTNIACQALPEVFSMGNLMAVYEAVTGEDAQESRDFKDFVKEFVEKDISSGVSSSAGSGTGLFRFRNRRYMRSSEARADLL